MKQICLDPGADIVFEQFGLEITICSVRFMDHLDGLQAFSSGIMNASRCLSGSKNMSHYACDMYDVDNCNHGERIDAFHKDPSVVYPSDK